MLASDAIPDAILAESFNSSSLLRISYYKNKSRNLTFPISFTPFYLSKSLLCEMIDLLRAPLVLLGCLISCSVFTDSLIAVS